MYIVEKFRPNAKNTVKRGRFRKCEKNFLATREKNFHANGEEDGGGKMMNFDDRLEASPARRR
jgi:hypothetical protein